MPEVDRHQTPVHADPEQTVCYCMDVTAGALRSAIADGARSVSDLQDATAACTGCGTCREDLLQLLATPGRGGPSGS